MKGRRAAPPLPGRALQVLAAESCEAKRCYDLHSRACVHAAAKSAVCLL